MLAAIKEVYFTRNVLHNHFKEEQNIDTMSKERRLQTNKKYVKR